MDEVLVHTELKQKLFDVVVYILLFMFALTMCFVGTLHIAEVSIGSGICYIVIGLVDLVMMGLYHKGEFAAE